MTMKWDGRIYQISYFVKVESTIRFTQMLEQVGFWTQGASFLFYKTGKNQLFVGFFRHPSNRGR